jgi:site-specific recombinase XerD
VASVFKSKGSSFHTIVYTDEHGRRRKKKGYKDKRESERLAMKLEERVAKVKNGDLDPKDERYRQQEGIALAVHLVDFKRALRAKGSGVPHVATVGQRVGRMLDLARAKRISDLSLSTLLQAVQSLRDAGLGQQSINHHITNIKSFCRWLWSDGRAREHHLAHLKTSSVASDRRHVRRLLSREEAARLIQAAETGPVVGNLSGPDRAMLYDLALGTGFRRNELRTLTPERFDLDGDPPTVTGKACYTKNGQEAVQPINTALAARLRPWLATKAPARPVFGAMSQLTAKMIRVDLRAANIPYSTDSVFADFHSLRCAYVSYLASSGASVKTCQTLARHSTPVLTFQTYAKVAAHDLAGAVERLPDFSPPLEREEEARKTGTDDTATSSATWPMEGTGDQTAEAQCRLHDATGDGASGALVLKTIALEWGNPCTSHALSTIDSTITPAAAGQPQLRKARPKFTI